MEVAALHEAKDTISKLENSTELYLKPIDSISATRSALFPYYVCRRHL